MTLQELKDTQLEQLKRKKVKRLTELGQSIYQQYRNGNIYSDELKEFADEILKIDQLIYETVKDEQPLNCECGNELNRKDRFCEQCGKEVTQTFRQDEDRCHHCESSYMARANFCHVCGMRRLAE